jgi:O-acetyl-ADP-ribose deacetylase (regulator of RNase III)
VAFPAVSAGIYGWPHEDAARIALTTVRQASCRVGEARFVLFTPGMHAIFAQVHAGLKPA